MLQDKSTQTVARAFEAILERSCGRKPSLLQTDDGKEFTGSVLQKVLERRFIRFHTACSPDVKASIVERVQRTMEGRVRHYFTPANTHRYIDVIQKIVDAYNPTRHSITSVRPVDVDRFDAHKVLLNIRGSRLWKNKRETILAPRNRVGDLVRISHSKGTFEKSFTGNYSGELFRIARVSKKQGLYTSEMVDLDDALIDGFFYNEELALVGKERREANRGFHVERVIRSEGRGVNRQVLVKWAGWPDKFNSWVKASELKSIEAKSQ